MKWVGVGLNNIYKVSQKILLPFNYYLNFTQYRKLLGTLVIQLIVLLVLQFKLANIKTNLFSYEF